MLLLDFRLLLYIFLRYGERWWHARKSSSADALIYRNCFAPLLSHGCANVDFSVISRMINYGIGFRGEFILYR